ncbi:GNAT family N-acetyltransferase [Hyphococcus sp.]|uniref:GNAT family N-acetyltransferase n=1 Tax=Hyphococcus sp. TaxID=2038636 RepID=UPI003CCB9C92
MSLVIRSGKAADIPALMALEHDAAQSYRAIGYDFCAEGAVRDAEEHKRALRDGATFVAEINAEPTGFILLWPADGRAHIAELSVAQRFQQQGIGRALIAAGESWAGEKGYRDITLTTFTEVPWNAPFYRSIGYKAFTLAPGDKDFAAIQAVEAAHGFHAKPRTAMIKHLP